MHFRSQTGTHAELFVADYLRNQGFTILEHSYKKFNGEIDLIACNKEVICFVEVKMRRDDSVPLQALVSYPKQKKLSAVAREYLTRHDAQYGHMIARFDVALVYEQGLSRTITYIPNAFMERCEGQYDFNF